MSSLHRQTRQAAIEWQVCLSSGLASDAERAAFEHWLAEHPAHGQAWARLNQALNSTLSRLSPGLLADGAALRRSLVGPQLAQRRRLGKLALAGGALLLGAAIGERYLPLRQLSATYVTRTGERRRIALPDGNAMALDARSAASLEGPGKIRVSAGAALFELAQAMQVELPQGALMLSQGRAMVRCTAERSLCLVLEGSAEIVTSGGARQHLGKGQSAWFSTTQIDTVQTDQTYAAAWQDGQLEVHDQPLQTVVDALAAYRPGWLRISPQAARLRVTGLFPLDDSDRSLEALRHTLPIRIARYGAWYVKIDVA